MTITSSMRAAWPHEFSVRIGGWYETAGERFFCGGADRDKTHLYNADRGKHIIPTTNLAHYRDVEPTKAEERWAKALVNMWSKR